MSRGENRNAQYLPLCYITKILENNTIEIFHEVSPGLAEGLKDMTDITGYIMSSS